MPRRLNPAKSLSGLRDRAGDIAKFENLGPANRSDLHSLHLVHV
jgi:hypothetical protein